MNKIISILFGKYVQKVVVNDSSGIYKASSSFNRHSQSVNCVHVILAFILLSSFAHSDPVPKKDSCQTICTTDYTPICGKPAAGKGTDITFGNACVLSNYNCEKKENRKWQLLKLFLSL